MEKLKSVLADKIIDVSSNGGDDVKIKLEKINHFRDFTAACQTLMNKYPAIEDEFIQMVRHNDFDTKVAASRVDTIIRLLSKEENQTQGRTEQKQTEFEDAKHDEPVDAIPEVDNIEAGNSQVVDTKPIVTEMPEPEPVKYLPEEIDYEEIGSENEAPVSGKYIDYEEVDETYPAVTVADKAEIKSESEEITEPTTVDDKARRNKNIKRIIQVIGLVIAIVLLIYIVSFIINNWKTILYVLGGICVVVLIIWMLIKKNKKK